MKSTSGVKLSASKNLTSLLRVSEEEMSSRIANSCTGEDQDNIFVTWQLFYDYVS